MRLLTQEWKKLIGSGQTIALFITVFAVGVVLTFFDGVPILGEPENARDAVRVSNLYTGTIYLAWIFPPFLVPCRSPANLGSEPPLRPSYKPLTAPGCCSRRWLSPGREGHCLA